VAFRRSDFDFQTLGSIVTFMALPEDGTVSPKPFAYLIGSGRFVAGLLWDGAFLVFQINQMRAPPASLVLAGWRDSSLALWNLGEPLYRKTRHLTAVVDVGASAHLRIVASLDKGRKCVRH
jgi:hypothetical protein